MALKVNDIGSGIVDAIKKVVVPATKTAKDFATMEGKKLAQTLVDIDKMIASKSIDEEQAALLLDMQKNASRSVLMALEGIAVLTAEQAVNAGLAAVSGVVNRSVGFALI